MAARLGLRADGPAMGAPLAEYAHAGDRFRLSGAMPAGRNEPLGRTWDHPAIRAVRRSLDRCPQTVLTLARGRLPRCRFSARLVPSHVPQIRWTDLRRGAAACAGSAGVSAGAYRPGGVGGAAGTVGWGVRLAAGDLRIRKRSSGHRSSVRQRPRAAGVGSRRAGRRYLSDLGGGGGRLPPAAAALFDVLIQNKGDLYRR